MKNLKIKWIGYKPRLNNKTHRSVNNIIQMLRFKALVKYNIILIKTKNLKLKKDNKQTHQS